MILAIDMGNSNIVVGGLDDNKTYFEERITTDDRKIESRIRDPFKEYSGDP